MLHLYPVWLAFDVAVLEWQNIPLEANGSANRVIRKIVFCLSLGTQLGWLIDPGDESVVVFEPNVTLVKADSDILPALAVLENWQLSVANLFGWLNFS